MNTELTIRICGEAGQGMQTVGETLCSLYQQAGLNIFANQDYMSRVRGGNNFFQLRIAGEPLYTPRAKADILVALDAASIGLHAPALNEGGIIILDKKKTGITQENKSFCDVPLSDIAIKTGGKEIFLNAVACGAVSALSAMEFESLAKVLRKVFSGKPEEIINKNLDAAKAGYDFINSSPRKNTFSLKKGSHAGAMVMNGNQAIALGAIRAGCKFYTAYPMTPSTSIMDTIAHYAEQFHIIVEQAEDEVAAINMALGASFAGVRAMTGTSGGGFALMVEGVSLAGMTETPVVVALSQRPGPATGFPTRTEQADLNFLLHAGHGEFARAVFSPGTAEEAFYLTVKAFNLAERYQIPVFIMTDQHLADSSRDIDAFDTGNARVKRFIISKEESKKISGYKRYALTDSGVSPRALPSWIEDVIYVDSDEHTEEGHITEDADVRVSMVEKRLYKKYAGLKTEIEKPVSHNTEGAKAILIGFGSTYGAIKETAEKLGTDCIHLPQIWPFPTEELTALLAKAKKTISVENNAGAQLAGLIRRETGIKTDASILKFDGRPFDADYLIDRVRKEL
ncbi:MAG: 2-oxoacid:acceptor oxidoreductase subunit alpha [Candidatus Omnitrophica bacterium]|nr:2-oxoacid:acceptor oxidoreductase subunit alpha [Candidatus Omnitrophota bacterium]